MARQKSAENSTTAVAYYRTSSAANVGADKDSLARQRAAVTAYAKTHGLEVVREFYDAAVSGADPIDRRPGFVEMLAYIHGDGARIVLIETANRFARDLVVQLTGHDLLKARGHRADPGRRARPLHRRHPDRPHGAADPGCGGRVREDQPGPEAPWCP